MQIGVIIIDPADYTQEVPGGYLAARGEQDESGIMSVTVSMGGQVDLLKEMIAEVITEVWRDSPEDLFEELIPILLRRMRGREWPG